MLLNEIINEVGMIATTTSLYKRQFKVKVYLHAYSQTF